MLLSGADITLGQHERCYLLAIPPTKHPCQAGPTRWRAFRHRREPTSETTIDYPQQVPPESPQSDNPGSYPSWLLVFVHASKTHCQIINHHQAVYPASFSRRIEEAKVSTAVLTKRWTQAWAEGALQRNDKRHSRDETAQSTIRLSPHCPTDQHGIRFGT